MTDITPTSSKKLTSRLSQALESGAQEGPIVLTDSEDEDEFVKKYGDIDFQYIKRPRTSFWFTRPHALNYFQDGVLYRTKGERSSTKTELFLDLMYVGIIANLAGDATEHAGWGALLKYILLFVAVWTVWCDIKDFTNYYYNEDLSQKVYILWILALLTVFCNNQTQILANRSGAAFVVGPYILCRVSLALGLFVYTFWIPEHRVQQRVYSATIMVTSCLWIIVVFVGTRAKIGLAVAIMVLENVCFVTCFTPWFKRQLGLTTSTALNIEHEVERFSVFVTIAIGEFLYKIVAGGDLDLGFQVHLWRGLLLLVDAYVLFWIYSYGSMARRATHALRHSAFRAVSWIYLHLPLVASIVLAADAGGDLVSINETKEAEEAEEAVDITAVKFFFTGGLCVALVSMGLLGLTDDPKDPPETYIVGRFWRVVFRIPVGVIVLVLPFGDLGITGIMGVATILMVVLLVWESLFACILL
ncbi:hypothetical protein PSN45_004161 [Yamadazyma tenuis]|uniref:uncharacterized protein n=1 Tax=Candida tenuis TaxID=2315449 RepID=UPI0027AB555F|nr:hypothetical protein PSN45_004161 [Yamadazyma tenuis]